MSLFITMVGIHVGAFCGGMVGARHSRGKRCLGCIRGYSRDSRVIERNPSSGSKDALLWADYSHLGIVQPRTQRGDVHAFLSIGTEYV